MKPSCNFFAALLSLLAFLQMRAPAQGQPMEIIPPAMHGAMQPQVAVAPNGTIHVVYGKGTAIYYTRSVDGRSFSAPVKVGELDKLALGMRRGPRIAATVDKIVVTAISHADGNIHAWVSPDAGATWRETQKINDSDKSAREGLHNMAGDGKGFVFTAWLDLREKGTQIWAASSQDGGATWSRNLLIYKSPDGHVCECCHPSVSVDTNGCVAVMWRNWLGGSRDFYIVASNDRGQTFTPPGKLGKGTWKLNACPMDGGSIALADKGAPVAVWRREKTVFASGPATIANEQRLAEPASQPVVVSAQNGITYIWQSGDGLMMQAQGKLPVRLADRAHMASAATNPRGGSIAVWESGAGNEATIMAGWVP